MLSAQAHSHLLNVLLLTLLIAPLLLWRYRRAVLGGMLSRPGQVLPVAAPLAPAAATAVASGAAAGALRWERALHRRLFAAVLGTAFVAALPVAACYLWLAGLPLSPAHLWLKAGTLACIAVPVHAVLTATPWWRALRTAVVTLLAMAAVFVLLTMLLRLADGRAPSLDQGLNALNFLQFAALTLSLPLLFGLVTGARRWRGVAPIVFAALLVFSLGPLLGLQLTQWLAGTRGGAEWILRGPGPDTGFVLLSLPMGLLAWWRLRSLARRYEAKRFSDLMLLAHTWWLMVVVLDALDLLNAQGTRALGPVAAASVLALLLWRWLLPLALRAALPRPRPAPRTLLVVARVRRHRAQRVAVRPAGRALALVRAGDDDRRARRGRAHRRPRRLPALRGRRHRLDLRHHAARPAASAGHAGHRARPGWPLPRERVLLPRFQLAGHRGAADRTRGCGRDGPARLRCTARRLRLRAR